MSTAAAPSPHASRFKGPRRHVPRLALTKRNPVQPPFVRAPSLNAPTPFRSRVSMTCSNSACPDPNLVEDDGRQVCATCGVVARESNIVSELQFGETSSGAAAVQGSYVGEGRTHGQSSGGPHPGLTRDGLSSREMTTLSARREIDALINNLRIPGNLADPALNIFKLSLAHAIYDSDGNREKDSKNFVQGRSIRTVAAVALYIACRRQRNTNTIMLIDLAETMTPQVSVFKMGNIYNRIVRAIWGTADGSVSSQGYVDPINPENLIRRFARDLEFGSLVGKVTEDAIRLVQRMDRDWMTTGRRPAGICGAALILAARMNNFRRTVREVVLIVKVCEVTVNNRLEEFQHTGTSNLTVQQMRQGDHTTPSDPPSFYRAHGGGKQAKKKGRKRKSQAPLTAAEIENGDEVTDEPPRKRHRVDKDGFTIPDIPLDPALRNPISQASRSDEPIAAALMTAVNDVASEMDQDQGSIAGESSTTVQSSNPQPEESRRVGRPKGSRNKHAPNATHAEIALEAEIEHEILDTINSQAMQRATPSLVPTASVRPSPAPESLLGATGGTSSQPPGPQPRLARHIDTLNKTPGPNSDDIIDPQREATAQIQSARPRTNEIRMDAEILEDEFEDDPEIANVILSEHEVSIKEHIWVEENKQWLRDEHAKRIKKQLQNAADIAAGLVPGQSTKKKRRKGRRLGDVSYLKDQEKASESGDVEGDEDEAGRARRAASIAMKGMLEQRGYSRRLNYDALSKMFPDDMASIREGSIETRRTVGKRKPTASREGSVTEGSGHAGTPVSPSTESVAASATPPRRPPSAVSPSSQPVVHVPAPSALQRSSQTLRQTSPLTSPQHEQYHSAAGVIEGEEELVGAISESDSPLSSLPPTMAYNSPLVGIAQSSGFGIGDGQGGEANEDGGDGESEGDPDDYFQPDEVEEAFQGRFNYPYKDDDDDDDDDDAGAEG